MLKALKYCKDPSNMLTFNILHGFYHTNITFYEVTLFAAKKSDVMRFDNDFHMCFLG